MKYFGVILVSMLAGCGALPQTGSGPKSAPAEACNAGAYQAIVGMDATSALAIPEPKREYIIGTPVTGDFVPERVNIQLDDNDVIVAITCG